MHPEEDSLLRAVAANPDDDAVRLVYADWVEEHGAADRAEFIRVQVERARLPEDDGRQAELAAREEELGGARRFGWARAVAYCVGTRFVRGFPDRVGHGGRPARSWKLSAADLEEMERAMGRLPLRTFASPLLGCRSTRFVGSDQDWFPPPGESGPEVLARWPALRRLTALELAEGTSETETCSDFTPGLEALAASPYAENVTRLKLGTRQYEPAALRAVAESPRLPRLEDLDLSHGLPNTSARAVALLLQTPLAARLRRLNCAWVPVAADVVRALLDAAPLRELSFGYREVARSNGLGPLLGAAGLRALRTLAVSGEKDGVFTGHPRGRERRQAVPQLLELLRSPQLAGLEKLSLAGAQLGDAGARALAEAPLARNLIGLHLDLCGLTGAGLRALRPLLAEGRLRRLSLRLNFLTDADTAELARWPELGRLHELNLGWINDPETEEEDQEVIRASPHRHPWLRLD
jgi:uncharacterized protein (TIGR02996 family)